VTWHGWLEGELAQIRERDQWRAWRIFDSSGPEGRLAGADTAVVSFASND
jgi:hypothetical protein